MNMCCNLLVASSGVTRWLESGFAHVTVTLLRLTLPFPFHHKCSQTLISLVLDLCLYVYVIIFQGLSLLLVLEHF